MKARPHSFEVICKQKRIRWTADFIYWRRSAVGFERINIGLKKPAASRKENPFKLLSNVFSKIPMTIRWQSFRNLLTSFRDSTSFLLNSMILPSAAIPIAIDFNGRKLSSFVKSSFWSCLSLTIQLKTSCLIIKPIMLLAVENRSSKRNRILRVSVWYFTKMSYNKLLI